MLITCAQQSIRFLNWMKWTVTWPRDDGALTEGEPAWYAQLILTATELIHLWVFFYFPFYVYLGQPTNWSDFFTLNIAIKDPCVARKTEGLI